MFVAEEGIAVLCDSVDSSVAADVVSECAITVVSFVDISGEIAVVSGSCDVTAVSSDLPLPSVLISIGGVVKEDSVDGTIASSTSQIHLLLSLPHSPLNTSECHEPSLCINRQSELKV